MATFTPIHSVTENLAKKLIDLSGTGLTIALTNTPHTATWDELADLTQISYTNLSARVLTVTSCTQTSGTLKLVVADLTLTASGTVPEFRYVYIYDDASTGDKLIGYLDYGSAVNMVSSDSFVIDNNPTTGILTISIA